MPTASQALILMSDESFNPRFPRRHFSASTTNNRLVIPMNITKPQKQQSLPLLENEKTEISDYGEKRDYPPGTLPHQVIDLLKGYRGDMYYDPQLKRFQWQIGMDGTILTNSTEDNSKDEVIEDDDDYNFRPVERAEKLLPRREDLITVSKDLPTVYGVDDKSYSRLEELGFRRRVRPSTPRKKTITNKPLTAQGQQPEISGWQSNTEKNIFVDCETPLTMVSADNYGDSANKTFILDKSAGDVSVLSDVNSGKQDMFISKKTVSLLEEIKQKVSFENRIFPAMFMRQVVPSDSCNSAVCFSLRDQNLTHTDVKRLVEAKTGCKVKSIRYDPVHVRGSSGGDIGCRWVIIFPTDEEGNKFVRSGMKVDDDKVIVKWYDDVIMWEYDAFLIFCEEERRKVNKTVYNKSKGDKRKAIKNLQNKLFS